MSDTIQSVKDLPEVSFIDNDTLEAMKTRMVANFESEWKRITGQEITLSPSDPNRIMLYAIALELYQDEQYIDRAGKQDLIKYSYGEFLDNLGAGRGVTRKQPAPAETTLRFTLSEKRPAAVGIPEGTKVTDGNLNYFATVGYEEIPAGETYVDVRALCTENGVDGNELLPGQVNVLVDLIPYVESVSNTTKTSGGADLESDESLAERIFLAPSGYSVAGPDDAYKYWTKTYSQTIGDVKVTSPNPVEVEIRFIMTDGELPTKTVIDGVAAYLQDENIRPLTDKVTVLAPETVKFNIAFTYYVNLSDQSKAGTIQAEVAQAVADYIEWQTRTIGRDINPSELMKRIVAAGAKRAVMLNVSGPFHSGMLADAGEKLGEVLSQVELHEPQIPYVANVTAQYVKNAAEVKELLTRQVSSSVRWQQSVEAMIADGVDTFIEIGPGKTLAGFMRKISRDVKTLNVEKLEDISKVAEALKS